MNNGFVDCPNHGKRTLCMHGNYVCPEFLNKIAKFEGREGGVQCTVYDFMPLHGLTKYGLGEFGYVSHVRIKKALVI